MQCKNSKIQNANNNIYFVMLYSMLTWIECLIFSFVFVVVGMYNLILLTSSICLVDRYEEHLFCKMYTWINNPLILHLLLHLPF